MNNIDTAKVDFEIRREPLYTVDKHVAHHDAIIRKDTDEVIGVVGEKTNCYITKKH